MEIVILLFTAMLISFLGQLPFGNMNMTATQLSVQESFKKAWMYGIGIAIVEIIYLRLALTGMDWVIQHKMIFKILGWITVGVFLILGILSFVLATKQSAEKKGLLLNNNMNRFWLGVSISAINPAQIPFWFIWATYLVDNGVLKSGFAQYNIFTAGAGLGTLAGLGVYIHGGNWAITKMKTSNKTLNIVMGIIFIATALIQLYKMIYDPWVDKSL
jgi:threonine/homoserine/homoserine lactone efflux protein